MLFVRWYSLIFLLLSVWGTPCFGTGEYSPDIKIIARTYVPNALLPQGEIRLVIHGEDVVVQSVLHTGFPGRVERKIVQSEDLNWGDDPDAQAYVTALKAGFLEYKKRKTEASETQSFTIDFVCARGVSRVDFSFPKITKTKWGFHIDGVEAWQSLPLSSTYVQKNQRYILTDAFGKQAGEILNKLAELQNCSKENVICE